MTFGAPLKITNIIGHVKNFIADLTKSLYNIITKITVCVLIEGSSHHGKWHYN